ncbi:uncharacterized protein Triagg1_4220 [Trichoderma aggressivum f. europaeum]|uniref:Uncharacterized protein n=1 Tax=Trichoderma aggressivum f. europaeum TaxID=173218 RepID=A0AAE1IDY0_9HYPO|nr:hypothetical protein Triagg1_4220 [Trichoderma aggressivum f. europaeum]
MSSTDNTSPPMADQSNSMAVPSSPDRNKKKRIRNWTADDRAAHRVFERSRREAFKERLTASLDSVSRVALHKVEQKEIADSLQRINRLVAERDDLLSELNTWRLNAGLEVHQARVTADDSEITASIPILDEAGASILRTGVSSISIGANNERGAGSRSLYLEEQSSFVARENDLPTEPVLDETVEANLPSTSMSMDIPWMSSEMDFTMPNSLTLAAGYDTNAPPKSPSYTHLPMSYDMANNNLENEPLRFSTSMMHMADPSTFHNETYIYTG